jgi:hypothetical protein
VFGLAVRSLMLACSLLLALPPGWCCLFRPAPVAAAQPSPTAKEPTCCGHCGQRNSAPVPAPKQQQRPLGECPCTEHHFTVPNQAEKVSTDIALVAFVIAPPALSRLDVGEDAGLLPDPLVLPLHLVHCTWRC